MLGAAARLAPSVLRAIRTNPGTAAYLAAQGVAIAGRPLVPLLAVAGSGAAVYAAVRSDRKRVALAGTVEAGVRKRLRTQLERRRPDLMSGVTPNRPRLPPQIPNISPEAVTARRQRNPGWRVPLVPYDAGRTRRRGRRGGARSARQRFVALS